MFTRYFHTTFLVIVSISILYILSVLLGKQPQLPKLVERRTLAAALTPTPLPQKSFIYYNQFATYFSFSIMNPVTDLKKGIYGSPLTDIYINFYLYNNQLFLQGKTTFGVLDLKSHFFYPVSPSSIPLTTSPSQTKALFLDTIKDQTTNLSEQQFRIETVDGPINIIPINQSNVDTLEPLCWIDNENTVLFKSDINTLYALNINKKSFLKVLPVQDIANINNIFCNYRSNMLYFQTKSGFFDQKYGENHLSLIPLAPNIAKNLSSLVFPQDSLENEALTASGSSILQLDLTTGYAQTIYTASQSASINPYLWINNIIVFTQQGKNPDKSTSFIGKILNTQNHNVNIFTNHRDMTEDKTGEIIPIDWLSQ